jgi:hypothetical protein
VALTVGLLLVVLAVGLAGYLLLGGTSEGDTKADADRGVPPTAHEAASATAPPVAEREDRAQQPSTDGQQTREPTETKEVAVPAPVAEREDSAKQPSTDAQQTREPTETKEVTVRALLEAHATGQADKYTGCLVVGEGRNAYPYEQDGREEFTIWISPYAYAGNGKLDPLSTQKDHLKAQMQGRRILSIVLKARGLSRPPKYGDHVRFTGHFQGEYKTIEDTVAVMPRKPSRERSPLLPDCKVELLGGP